MNSFTLKCPVHNCDLIDQVRCPNCDFKLYGNLENEVNFTCSRANQGIYGSYEEAYEEISVDDLQTSVYDSKYQIDLASQTKKKIGNVNNLTVAEFGVGQGFLQKEFLKDNPKEMLALDIAEEYIQNAKKLYKNSSCSTKFITSIGNVEFLPYQNCFDLVVATDIIEHVLNLGNALFCISRSLKTKGKFACRVPYKEALGQYSIYRNQKYSFSHLRFFNESLISLQLLEVGLKPIKFHRYGYIQGRFGKLIPKLFIKNFYGLFKLIRLYGENWYDFSRRSNNYPHRFFNIFHQPLELLVIAEKI